MVIETVRNRRKSQTVFNLLVFSIGLALSWTGLLSAAGLGEDGSKSQLGAKPQIVVYGDSISAAFGIDPEKGFVSLLAQSLEGRYEVVNASISGDTTVAGLARLPVTIAELKPDLLLLELGANDGLQGLPLKDMQANLEAMIELALANGSKVALLAVTLPPSYGPRYVDQFRAVFPTLAQKYQIPMLDLYREKFVIEPGYIQQDGLHPTEKTQPIVHDMILNFLIDENLVRI